ncbi:MAG: triose-phosphate isomerase, partial [Nanoarchaeota archaeon]
MKTPLILVNFKTYETGTGDHALRIAKLCEEVANETGVSIAIAVQPTDLRMIAEAVQIPVFAQHVDGISFGSNTGHILPHAIKQAGASGTLLNHSEDRYSDENLTAAMKACKDNGIFVIA